MGFWKFTKKVTLSGSKLTAKALGKTLLFTGKGIALAGKTTYKHREKIGGTVTGVAVGTAKITRDASGHLISKDRIAKKVRKVEEQSRRYKTYQYRVGSKIRIDALKKETALDSLIVGGETLGAYLAMGKVPEDIQQAYEMAYPGVAALRSFSEQVDHLNGYQLLGFATGIKGKLFELKYVDYLNNGQLPDGYVAELAKSPTIPGWDIVITGPDAAVSELIQAKATDSVSYVLEAIKQNPQIDVVTTSEVYGHLVMQGFGDHVIDSGISDAALEEMVHSGLEEASGTIDWMPSAVSLALIAFTSYKKEGLTNYQKSKDFGDRSARAYLCYLVGGTLAVATNTWWIGVVCGAASRFLLGSGRQKWDKLKELNKLIKTNEKVLKGMEAQMA